MMMMMMYCNDISNWLYCPTVGPQLSGRPADPYDPGPTELSRPVMMMVMMMMMMMTVIIIIIIIIMYSNIFNWQYCPTVGPELSGRPADPYYQGTTELSAATETIIVINCS
jgi:hypothetical protein